MSDCDKSYDIPNTVGDLVALLSKVPQNSRINVFFPNSDDGGHSQAHSVRVHVIPTFHEVDLSFNEFFIDRS